MLTDMYLRRDRIAARRCSTTAATPTTAGLIALVLGIVVSVLLFANQQLYTGLVAAALPQIGDIGFLVGLVLAAGTYALLFPRLSGPRTIGQSGTGD